MQKEELLNLRNSGKTLKEIALVYGVSHQRISQILGRVGILNPLVKGYQRCRQCKKDYLKKDFYGEKANRCIQCTKLYIKKYTANYAKDYKKGGKYYPHVLARKAVSKAIRTGQIIRGKCFMRSDECKGRLEANHYLGYEKEHWLDIQWLCHEHHRKVDKFGW